VPLCRVGTLAPVHPTVRRLVGQGQAAAGCEHVGDQLLGLGERLGSGRGDRGGSRLNPGRQLRGGGNAPVPPVGRLRGQLAFEALELLASAVGQLGVPGFAAAGDPNQVTRPQGRGGDPMRVALHHAGRRARGDPAQDGELRIVQSDGPPEHGRLISGYRGRRRASGRSELGRACLLPAAGRGMV